MTTYNMSKVKAGDTFTKRDGVTDVYWKVVGVSCNGVIFADAFSKEDNSFICSRIIEKRYEDSLWFNAVVYTPPKISKTYVNVCLYNHGEPYVTGNHISKEDAEYIASSDRKGMITITAQDGKISVEYEETTKRGDVS